MGVSQLWVQSTVYNAVEDRLAFAGLLPPGSAAPYGSGAGVRGPADLALAMTDGQHGSVSPGVAYIPWANSIYMLGNDAAYALTFAAANPTNPRIDLVVAQVYDAVAGGANAPAAIRVITGTAAPSPVPPAVPDGAIALCSVRYNAGSNAPILADRRAFLAAGPVVETAFAVSANPGGGQISPGLSHGPFAGGTFSYTLRRRSLIHLWAETYGLMRDASIAGYLELRQDGVIMNGESGLGRRFHSHGVTTGALVVSADVMFMSDPGAHTWDVTCSIDGGSDFFAVFETPFAVQVINAA